MVLNGEVVGNIAKIINILKSNRCDIPKCVHKRTIPIRNE